MGSIHDEIEALANPVRAEHSQAYFKTGPGEYGEGDVFIGLTVPQVRTIAKKYRMLPFGDIEKLLASPIHEHRLCAIEILVERYTREPDVREQVYAFTLEHRARANNWDLIDGGVSFIVGQHLLTRQRKQLYTFARSHDLWERRIAIVATGEFIKGKQYADTLAIAQLLLKDTHDLIHKATGWMLREVGKKDKKALETFLRAHAHVMPRTMLRYAIERFPERERKAWLLVGKGKAVVTPRHVPLPRMHR